MSYLTDPVRAGRRVLITGGLILFVLGVCIGRWSFRPVPDSPAPTGLPDNSTHRPPAPLPVGTLDAAASRELVTTLKIGSPQLRRANLVDRGYNLAGENIENALDMLASISDARDRAAFLEGIFAYAAHYLDPGAVLTLATGLEQGDRQVALREIAATWTAGRTLQSAESLIERFGLEAGLGLALYWDESYRLELGKAWIKAFADDEGKGVMLGTFAGGRMTEDPQAALAMGARLRSWDREVFMKALAVSWADKKPADAWNWALRDGHRLADPASFNDIVSGILTRWARQDLEAAETAFAELDDPGQRQAAAEGLANVIADRRGTVAAVNWASSLTSVAEQDAAHRAIASTSPQGIGVALGQQKGFTTVNQLIPDGAADRSGQLQEGDRIVEVDPGTGEFEEIYGRNLQHAMGLIRGESGSTMRLRIIRENDSGTLEDHIVELQREQIVLQGS